MNIIMCRNVFFYSIMCFLLLIISYNVNNLFENISVIEGKRSIFINMFIYRYFLIKFSYLVCFNINLF